MRCASRSRRSAAWGCPWTNCALGDPRRSPAQPVLVEIACRAPAAPPRRAAGRRRRPEARRSPGSSRSSPRRSPGVRGRSRRSRSASAPEKGDLALRRVAGAALGQDPGPALGGDAQEAQRSARSTGSSPSRPRRRGRPRAAPRWSARPSGPSRSPASPTASAGEAGTRTGEPGARRNSSRSTSADQAWIRRVRTRRRSSGGDRRREPFAPSERVAPAPTRPRPPRRAGRCGAGAAPGPPCRSLEVAAKARAARRVGR